LVPELAEETGVELGLGKAPALGEGWAEAMAEGLARESEAAWAVPLGAWLVRA